MVDVTQGNRAEVKFDSGIYKGIAYSNLMLLWSGKPLLNECRIFDKDDMERYEKMHDDVVLTFSLDEELISDVNISDEGVEKVIAEPITYKTLLNFINRYHKYYGMPKINKPLFGEK